jgi:hypothetical protein
MRAKDVVVPLGRTLAALLVIGLVLAPPASAHGDDMSVPAATDYVSRITGFSSAVDGLSARMVDATTGVELRNDSQVDVVVLGYQGEPYLRIGPTGSYVNSRSPTPAMNDPMGVAPPTTAAGGPTEPVWRKKDSQPVTRWHDHRTHWMGSEAPPSGDQSEPRLVIPSWTLPLAQGDNHFELTGQVVWMPPPSAVPFVVLALVVAGLIGALAVADEILSLLVLGGLTAVVGIVECVAVVGAPEASGSVQLVVFGPVALAAIGAGIWFLQQDDRRSGRLLIVSAAVVVGVLAGVVKTSYLGAVELPTALPAWLARTDVAVAMGVLLGAALVTMWWAARTLAERSSRSRRPGVEPQSVAP